jgi:hypothetical protein
MYISLARDAILQSLILKKADSTTGGTPTALPDEKFCAKEEEPTWAPPLWLKWQLKIFVFMAASRQ